MSISNTPAPPTLRRGPQRRRRLQPSALEGNAQRGLRKDPISLISRIRYIDGMRSRAEVQYPTDHVHGSRIGLVFDFAVEANVSEHLMFRVGLTTPSTASRRNMHRTCSGTDPSLYDVIGRRAM